MRRRLIITLTFPIVIYIFLMGWLQFRIPSKKISLKKEPAKESTAMEKQAELASDEGIEFELIKEGTVIECIKQHEVSR